MIDNQSTDSSFYIILGDRIRLARVAAGIDQDTFAKSIDLTRASVANIEKGRQRPSVYLLWLMAQVLNLTITDLIPPLDIKAQVDDWLTKIENNVDLEDESQRKRLLDFISATRNIK